MTKWEKIAAALNSLYFEGGRTGTVWDDVSPGSCSGCMVTKCELLILWIFFYMGCFITAQWEQDFPAMQADCLVSLIASHRLAGERQAVNKLLLDAKHCLSSGTKRITLAAPHYCSYCVYI